jgi:uncharacterized phage infection (PIP) family protein YhgE
MPERVYLTPARDLTLDELKKLKKSELVKRCIYSDRVIDNGWWWVEDEVKELKEEIKKLKEERNKVVSKIHEMNDTKNSPTKDFHNNLSNVVWYYFKAKDDEIAKLKEELKLSNEGLIKENHRADKNAAIAEAVKDLSRQVCEQKEKLREENEKLKEEINKLKE